MRRMSRSVIGSIVVLSFATAIFARESQEANSQQSTPTVTAFASADRVRFTAPSSVVQIRLEVYGANGEKLFDNELKGGNVLDWLLQNGQAERLASGHYLCVVTVKTLSGKFAQKLASLSVEGNVATLKPIDVSQLTVQQAQSVGPVEGDASLSIVTEDEPQTPTVIAHNGEEGQIVRGKGALSFRIGDFFRGKDAEQMRLTPEGNLGIGITHPQVRLDVDGFIRASQGIIFPDGTVQYSAASKTLGAPSTTWDVGKQQPTGPPSPGNTRGRRRNGEVRPFTDGVFDVNASGGSYNINAARMGIGTANPLVRLHVGPGAAPPVTAGATLLLEEGIATSMVMKSTTGGEMFMYQDQNNGTFGTASTHPLGIRTNNINRIWIEAGGNVGIGTMNPTARLAVRGDGTDVLLGSAGCPAPTAAIGFGTMSGCNNFALGGDVSNTANAGIYFNRPTGQSMHFREGNGPDQMTIAPGGNVSIGSNPFGTSTLAIIGGAEFSGYNFPLVVRNGDGSELLAVVGSNMLRKGVTVFLQEGLSNVAHVCYTTYGTARVLATCSSAAEYVPTYDIGSGHPEPGDLVRILPEHQNPYGDQHAPFVVAKTEKPYDNDVLGFVLNPEAGADGKKLNEHYLPLAIYGYFPVKITLENGPIKRGDPITSSSKPGYGMKATQACKIIGYALEDANQEGKIRVFAHLSDYTAPHVTALQAQFEKLQQENAARLTVLEQAAQQLKALHERPSNQQQ